MPGKRKAKKLNTKENQDNIKKDLQKKRMEKRKQIQQRYAQNGGGSKVVQRTKADVSRAPAYKAEKISKGSYHSTFPLTGSGNGFFDQVQLLNEMLSSKERKLSIESVLLQKANELKLTPEQTEKLVEANSKLQESETNINNAKQYRNILKQTTDNHNQLQQISAEIGVDLDILRDPDATNGLIGEARNNLKAMNENIERLNNSNDILRKAKRAHDDNDIAFEEAKQLRDEYLEDLDKEADKDLIKEIESIKLDDHEAFKRVFDRISEHDDSYQKSKAELQHLRDLRQIVQDDRLNQDIFLGEMKALGREHPHFAAKVAELEMKYRKEGGVENALRTLLSSEKKQLKSMEKKRDNILKEYTAFGEKVAQFKKEKEDFNEKTLKGVLRDNYYLPPERQQEVENNDFEANANLLNIVGKQAQIDHNWWIKDCNGKIQNLNELMESADTLSQNSKKLSKYMDKVKVKIDIVRSHMVEQDYNWGEEEDWNEEDNEEE